MRIKRALVGSSWLVVDDTEDGREIVHGRTNTISEAVAYLEERGDTTRQALDELERDDARVRFRQRYKRVPTDEELADA